MKKEPTKPPSRPSMEFLTLNNNNNNNSNSINRKHKAINNISRSRKHKCSNLFHSFFPIYSLSIYLSILTIIVINKQSALGEASTRGTNHTTTISAITISNDDLINRTNTTKKPLLLSTQEPQQAAVGQTAPTTTITIATIVTTTQPQQQLKLSSIYSSLNLNNNNNNTRFDLLTRIPSCTLGNGTYQLGERWNPNLPPFGVQVCVQCECTVRQRKNCYESRVTCRRITNECPIIDSCPDGKKPVTNPGQCCKSCQTTIMTAYNADDYYYQRLTAGAGSSSEASYQTTLGSLSTIDRYYKNDRIKEYHSIIKNFEACSKNKENNLERQTISLINTPNKSSKSSSSGSKNDLNGIDSRIAFKSLHDTQGNHQYNTNHVTTNTNSHLIGRPASNYNSAGGRNNNNNTALEQDVSGSNGRSTTNSNDEQHPNDVQSLGVSNSNNINNNINQQQQQNINRFIYNSMYKPKPPSYNTCTLGNETFEVGDRWNPELPPFGIQVCVLCNCVVIRDRSRACYETKVQCRRINSECPNIDYCSDGSRPISIPGQCCKGCLSNSIVNKATTFLEQQSNQDQQQQHGVIIAPEKFLQKSEKVVKEFQSLMKQFPACSKREGEMSTTTTTTTTPLTTTTTTTISPSTISPVTTRNNNNYKFVRRSSI